MPSCASASMNREEVNCVPFLPVKSGTTRSCTFASDPNTYGNYQPCHGACSEYGECWKTGQRKPNKYREGDQTDASHCSTYSVKGGRVLPTVSGVHSGSFLLLFLVLLN